MKPRQLIDLVLIAAGAVVLLAVVPIEALIYWSLTGFGLLAVFVAGRIVGQLAERRRQIEEARQIEVLRDALAHTDPARYQ